MYGGQGFGQMMGGMGGFGGINSFQGNSPLAFMGKNRNPNLGDTGVSGLGGGASMMPANQPQRFNPMQNPQGFSLPREAPGASNPIGGLGGPLAIPAGSAISRYRSMPELPNGPAGASPLMQNAHNDMGMLGKLQGLMPQNFAQNPQLGGLLQNPQLLQVLMHGMGGMRMGNADRVR
jgi:hypothetical protein